ncbi:MAG: KH domain-containing protein [Desulfobacteraceae bacterium]|jgi:spoIIIJ-associated protein|nr:MAG: KH domain-containing protein [Desulfobacteraceae bacterium]
MDSYEFQGKNTEEAIANARRELGLSSDQMEIEVIEPGSAGIFGLVGGRKAKIKVTVKETKPLLTEKEEDVLPLSGINTVNGAQGMNLAKSSLEKILSLIPMEGVAVTSEQADGTITLTISGDSSGLLIGRRGKTLDALQFVVNRIVNKVFDERFQVIVDSENYRLRHRNSIVDMALKLSDKAKKSKKPVSTNPLSPYDRRLVHLALRDDTEIETKSRGEGMMKKVVIIPRRSGMGQSRSARSQEAV